MDKVTKNKRGLNQSLFKSQNKFRKIPLFVIFYLSIFDDAM